MVCDAPAINTGFDGISLYFNNSRAGSLIVLLVIPYLPVINCEKPVLRSPIQAPPVILLYALIS
jgi:hypothetical protein